MKSLRFRPHHFLCTIGFEGKGYSDEFVAGYQKIADRLRGTPEGDDTIIEVTPHTDSICDPCPNKRDLLCTTQEKITKLDQAHAEILGLKAGDRLTWGEAKERIRVRMTKENFDRACAPCSWKEAGMCEKALNRLKETPALPRTKKSSTAGKLSGLALLCTLALSPISADAAPKQLDPIDALEKEKPTPAARALKRALDAANAGSCMKVRKEVAAPLRSSVYADHALFLRARCAEKETERAVEEKKWDLVLEKSAPGIADLHKIQKDYLYSPWLKDVSEEIGKLELLRGLALAQKKKWKESTAETEKGLQRLVTANALYYVTPAMIESYASTCQKKESPLCRPWVQRLANTYAKHSIESKTLARFYPDTVAAAKPNFANSKITTGYKQKDSDEDAFDKAFPLVIDGKWKEAKETLEKFLTDFPRSTHRHRARYWLAVVTEKEESAEKAKALYEQVLKESPLTLYGLLSAWATKTPLETRFSAERPKLIDSDDFQTPVEAVRFARAKKLIAGKAYRLAAQDLREIRSRDTAEGGYLLYLAKIDSIAGAHLAAFSILSEMIARGDEAVYTSFGLDLVFPVVQWEIIQKQAKAEGVDPILVMSLIKQESAFDGEAHSVSGASGYMQLMPFTASDVEGDVERRDLLDAETNIRIGTKYLKKMITRFGGNIPLALAAYNAGPSAVDRWVKEGRASKGMLEFIEQIPYRETRDYVGTIFRNYVWYKKRLESKEVTSTADFWPILPPPPAT